ncbi:helix-turn-helix domain-containing protein [Companilactobacillus nuruki]|uniref:HTH cro/C1-type domain-containing protein n=1 Tax=Companilactobacillus nuruki TaxID=1993540 RepID=A0A2N7AX18_9LACO|nr:helix-turn-helix transcriptional regulator [Companilactobacillus nuruki]PMD73309.1 hypothetical protein CBP76_02155 [Companilactobacillus nuruki]
MLLGSVVYNKRRSLNLTQSDLAKDLCNQNTISKLEKHNMTPQIEVLIKICKRLDLTLDQIFSDFSSDYQREKTYVLDNIEQDAVLDDTSDLEEKLALVKKNVNKEDMAQLHLIEAIVDFRAGKLEDASFNLDKINLETKMDNDNIYTMLSFLIKGKVCLEQDNIEMSEYYFKIVYDAIKENFNFSNAKDFEILYLCKELGLAFAKLGKRELTSQIIHRGIEYAKKNGRMYFLDEFYMSLAISKHDSKNYEKYKNMAYYTALAVQHDKIAKEIEGWD